MLRNYLTIAFRTLRRNLGYTVINLTGLAVGMAACLLIGLYVRFELSYDTFHAKSDRIYRVDEVSDRDPTGEKYGPYVEIETGPALKESIPEVERVVRMSDRGPQRIERGSDGFDNVQSLYAGAAFFDVFSFELVAGKAQRALRDPNSIVLTQSFAERVFGDADPLGQTMTIDDWGETLTVEVTGVLADVPANSHIAFDGLLSLETLHNSGRTFSSQEVWTYVLLADGTTPAALDEPLQQVAQNFAATPGYDLVLRPLTDLYFHYWSPQSGDVRYVYVLTAIAAIILLIACANYMNLATARASRRIREVGVRKTLGARRTQLAGQFLGETVLLSLMALPLAVGLLQFAVPTFNRLADASVTLTLAEDATTLLGFAGVAVLIGLLAGSYPALFLSGFRPIEVIREQLTAGWSGARLRKGLIVFQFALSAVLLFCTAIVLQQLGYVQNKKLGFDQERVVTIPIGGRFVYGAADAFKSEVARLPGVQQVALANGAPGGRFAGSGMVVDWDGEEIALQKAAVDADFLKTLDIDLVAGRNLTPAHVEQARGMLPGREAPFCLLNETAVRALGWSSVDQAVGQTVDLLDEFTVVGVVEDFHFESLRNEIAPLVIVPAKEPSTLVARIAPGDMSGTIDALHGTWRESVSDLPFTYHFLDDQIDQLYRSEQRTAGVIGGFAGLAVLLACLGLFGLAAYAAERRTKEIGIRKALGASIANIVTLLSKEFMLLVAIACAVGAPVAYFAMERWLQDFAYRVDVSPLLFVASSALAVGVALAAISYQAIQAARTDPADALRSE
jgi:putative ABC transport system permease protein